MSEYDRYGNHGYTDYEQVRLEELLDQYYAAFVFDVHGFTQEYENEEENERILEGMKDLVEKGCVLAAVTGYGDRIYPEFLWKLKQKLEDNAIKPESAPVLLSTRNGALTTHAFTDTVIDSHPIPLETYLDITNHPLVCALHELTPIGFRDDIWTDYIRIQRDQGMMLNPYRGLNPNFRHDWHTRTGAAYQLTIMYAPTLYSINTPEKQEALQTLKAYTQGNVPKSVAEMSQVIQHVLNQDGIPVGTQSAATHPVVDIVMPEVNKGLGVKAIIPYIARRWRISPDAARTLMIGGGDSPTQNDAALINSIGSGVTNVQDGASNAVFLDFLTTNDQISRTSELIRRIKVLPYRIPVTPAP